MVGGSAAAFGAREADPGADGQDHRACRPCRQRQAAKICNNMILGVSMIAVSEAFLLAGKLGLDAQTLFDISSKSSGSAGR